MKVVLTVLVLFFFLLSTNDAAASRKRKHTVKPGESIAQIANFHGVSQETLIEANDIGKRGSLQPGDVLSIPNRLVDGWTKSHIVKSGDTIAQIARRYKVKKGELRKINKIGPKGRLKLGRRLVIPTGKRVDTYETSADDPKGDDKKKSKVKKKPWNGKVTFVRVRGNERKTVTMFDKRGRIRTYAKKTITRLARSRKGKIKRISPKLITLLGKVAKHFPGKDIEIISGYRPHKRGKKKSQHSKGRALDFRVRGVSNKDLYSLIKTFKKVGAGYYPNSTFVHLDVRRKKYLWTDISGPGEPARYLKHEDHDTQSNLTEDGSAGQPDPENFPEDE